MITPNPDANSRPSESPTVTTKLQQLMVWRGPANTTPNIEYSPDYTYEKVWDDNKNFMTIYATPVTAHDQTRLQELLEALPEKHPDYMQGDYSHGRNQAIDEMEAAVKKVYGGLE